MNSTLDAPTVSAIGQFWASFLGCSDEQLQTPGVHIAARPGALNHPEMFALRLGDCCILSVPAPFVEAVRVNALGRGREIYEQESLRAVLHPANVHRVIGPCYLGYTDSRSFAPVSHSNCRVLTVEDAEHTAGLRAACGDDWDIGGIEVDGKEPVFGCFEGGRLVAAASYEVWGGMLAHICIVTAPDSRGRGFAKAAASASILHALNRGLVPQWRTLASNTPSVAVATSLGFQAIASHYVVKFTP